MTVTRHNCLETRLAALSLGFPRAEREGDLDSYRERHAWHLATLRVSL